MVKPIILCIDDEKTILQSLRSQLRRQFGSKFSYEFAESAEEGLEVIEELSLEGAANDLQVIISDWLMPGMKGDEFLMKIHKLTLW